MRTRSLRKRLTPQEVKLWVKLRELKPLGFHFRRQAPVGRYIIDFASYGARLVIDRSRWWSAWDAPKYSADDTRYFLRSQGFRVLRFWNSDIDQNLSGVMQSIAIALNTPTPAGKGVVRYTW